MLHRGGKATQRYVALFYFRLGSTEVGVGHFLWLVASEESTSTRTRANKYVRYLEVHALLSSKNLFSGGEFFLRGSVIAPQSGF